MVYHQFYLIKKREFFCIKKFTVFDTVQKSAYNRLHLIFEAVV